MSLTNVKKKRLVRMQPLQIKVKNIVWFLAITVTLIFFLGPLYITIMNSFKATSDIVRHPLNPYNMSMINYIKIFADKNINIWMMYGNSILLTSISILMGLITAPMAGYYIARSSKKVGTFFTMFFLMGLMVPPQITLIPMMSVFVKLHLIGTIWSVILVYGANVFVIILFSKFVVTIPVSIEESAFTDGASIWVTFFKIILPLMKPMIATSIIFTGLDTWNDFINPLLLFKSFKTITYGIYVANSVEISDYGFILAFVVLASLPIIIMYLFIQKLFIAGLTGGAVKG